MYLLTLNVPILYNGLIHLSGKINDTVMSCSRLFMLNLVSEVVSYKDLLLGPPFSPSPNTRATNSCLNMLFRLDSRNIMESADSVMHSELLLQNVVLTTKGNTIVLKNQQWKTIASSPLSSLALSISVTDQYSPPCPSATTLSRQPFL